MTKYVFLDTETTGLNPHKGNRRIIDLSCIEYEDSAPTGNVFKLKTNPEGKKYCVIKVNWHPTGCN